MELERKGVSITWLIENVKCLRQLFTPVIAMDVMDGTKWTLGVHRTCDNTIWLTIKREEEDNGPENFGLNYEFSITELHGAASTVEKAYTYTFEKNRRCPEVKVNTDYPNHLMESNALPPDAITIRCKIYKQRGSISKSVHVFVGTRMTTESCIFIAEAEKFSMLHNEEGKTLKLLSLPTGEELLTLELLSDFRCINSPKGTDMYVTVLFIRFDGINKYDDRFFNVKFFILDASGNKTGIGKLEKEFTMRTCNIFMLPDITKEIIMKNAVQYLRNDTLSFLCELTFTTGIENEKVEITEYETDSVVESVRTDFASNLKFLTCHEGLLSNTSLNTSTETFPAHTAILSAQSPIFEAMFKTSMKETIQKSVDIDDVDAKTIRNMLMFLYSDTLEELEWKDAMKLYFAADKYLILSLRQKCSELLKRSVDLSNCCVLLHLADMHQDEDLKRVVHGFIAEYDKEVLYCDQWRYLEEIHPHLAINYFRDQYLDKRFFRF